MDTRVTKTVKGLLDLQPDDLLCKELPGSSRRSSLCNALAKAEGAPTTGGSLQCYSLDKLPFEIKTMIYMGILVSESAISNGNLPIGKHRSFNRRTIDDIDSRILRACRAIYKDALEVSYAYSCSVPPITGTWIILHSKGFPGEF